MESCIQIYVWRYVGNICTVSLPGCLCLSVPMPVPVPVPVPASCLGSIQSNIAARRKRKASLTPCRDAAVVIC